MSGLMWRRKCYRQRAKRTRFGFSVEMRGYLFEKRSMSDCLGYGSESVGSGLAGGVAAAVALGAGDTPLDCWPGGGE
jgi:hypothetical protein